MSTIQKIIRFFVSAETFSKMESASKKWYFHCECGNECNIWEIGGIRYKAAGNPIKAARCPKCHKVAMRKLHKK